MAQIFQLLDDDVGLGNASEEELSEHDAEDKDDEGCIYVGSRQNFVTWSNLETVNIMSNWLQINQ